MTAVTRRAALRLLGALALESSFPFTAGIACSQANAPIACRDVAALLHAREQAATLGERWLESVPKRPSAEELLLLLVPDGAAHAQRALDSLRSDLARRHRLDFRDGRTEEVEGWLLSETETLLYGLAALCRD